MYGNYKNIDCRVIKTIETKKIWKRYLIDESSYSKVIWILNSVNWEYNEFKYHFPSEILSALEETKGKCREYYTQARKTNSSSYILIPWDILCTYLTRNSPNMWALESYPIFRKINNSTFVTVKSIFEEILW